MTPLATILVERGISQDELVRRTGLTGRAVSHAYHGRSVSFSTRVKIAMALDVRPGDLDPEATECRRVRALTGASELPGETPVLTSLQRDILVLVVNGLTNGQIADRLGVRPGLIGTHIGSITRALGVTSRAELATAVRLLHEMGMAFWLPEAERELRQVDVIGGVVASPPPSN